MAEVILQGRVREGPRGQVCDGHMAAGPVGPKALGSGARAATDFVKLEASPQALSASFLE